MVLEALGILNARVPVPYIVFVFWVHGSFYDFNLWNVLRCIFWVLWLLLVFLQLFSCYYPWTWSVLMRTC